MDVDLGLVRHFVGLADGLTFSHSRAATRIREAVGSEAIGELEAALGIRLFAQTLQGIRLSAAGRAYIPHARRMLQEADAARAAVDRVRWHRPGSLRLGWAWGSDLGPAERIVRAFRARCPRARVTIDRGVTATLLDGLRRDDLDAIFVRPPLEDAEGVEHLALTQQAMVLAMPEQHPLAYVSPLRPDDLHDDRFILYPRQTGPGMYDAIAAHLWGGADPKLYVSEERLGDDAVIEAVAQGGGLGVVFAAGTDRRRVPGVTYRSIDPPLLVDLDLAWRTVDPNPMLAALVDVAGEMVAA